jgi:hypothetical protein
MMSGLKVGNLSGVDAARAADTLSARPVRVPKNFLADRATGDRRQPAQSTICRQSPVAGNLYGQKINPDIPDISDNQALIQTLPRSFRKKFGQSRGCDAPSRGASAA